MNNMPDKNELADLSSLPENMKSLYQFIAGYVRTAFRFRGEREQRFWLDVMQVSCWEEVEAVLQAPAAELLALINTHVLDTDLAAEIVEEEHQRRSEGAMYCLWDGLICEDFFAPETH